MTEASREVGVVVRRRSIDNPWIDQLWSPAMILDEVPSTAPWTVLWGIYLAAVYLRLDAFDYWQTWLGFIIGAQLDIRD